MGLTPITEKKFRKKLKGCGIKNYSLIPKKELKEKLGFCSKNKPQQEKIRDREGDAQSSPWDILISVKLFLDGTKTKSVSREVRKVSRRAWSAEIQNGVPRGITVC